MDNLLIKDIAIIPMTDDQIIEHGYIYIESGKIKEVHSGDVPDRLKSAPQINGKNKAVIPGLINAHTHTPMSILRGYKDGLPLMEWLQEMWAVEDRMSHEDMYWSSLLSMAEMIQSGTTTFCDMYFGMERIASGVEETGMRALLAEGIIEKGNNGEEILARSVAFVKNCDNQADGRIHALLSPHAPYTCPPDLIKKIVEEAHKLDCSIHTHLAETEQEIQQIQASYQATPIQLMEDIGLFTRHVIAAHGVYVTDEEMEILKNRHVGIIHNPKSNMKLASGVAPITEMLKNNVTVGLGTDGSASNNILDMFEEMRFASLMQKVHLKDPLALPAYETLAMATSECAKAVNLEHEIGTIETGKKADLTIINLDAPHVLPVNDLMSHLIYAVKAEDVAYTIADGKILLNNGELTTIDLEKVVWHISEIKDRLI